MVTSGSSVIALGKLRRTLLASFRTGGFLRNVSVIASGSAIAQGLAVLASPLLTRLYSPADFGVFGVYLSVVPILSIVSTLQYQQAIVLPKDERRARVIFGATIRIAVRVVLLMLVLAALLRLVLPLLDQVIGLGRFGLGGIPWVVLPVVAIAVALDALGVVFNFWNIRTKSFSLITAAGISAAVAALLLKLGMGMLAAGWWGLLAGALLGKIVNLSVQMFHGGRFRTTRDALVVSADKEFRREVLREQIDFPRYRLPQNLLNTLSRNFPTILLVAFFGPDVGGLYALAQRVIKLPGTLIANAIRNVFYQKAAELGNRGSGLFEATIKTTLGLAVIGLIPFGFVILFGPGVFSVVFGETWRVAGVYAAWLAVWIYFAFCNVPSLAAIPVAGLQKQLLLFEIVVFVTRVIALSAGAVVGSPLVAVVLYSVTGAFLNLLLILLVHLRIKRIPVQLSGRMGSA